ncbi:hypothetical protein FOVSG1_011978 [Fusarium oxysporum f. sp. vasinfectum]
MQLADSQRNECRNLKQYILHHDSFKLGTAPSLGLAQTHTTVTDTSDTSHAIGDHAATSIKRVPPWSLGAQRSNQDLPQKTNDPHRIDIKDLTSDAGRQEAEALVMEIKVCEFKKERKNNKDKIVQIENDIRHVQADVSAFDDRYKTHDADFLQTREEQEELVSRLDTIDENQEEQKKQHEENMREISEDLRCDVAKGLMQGINWD